MKNDFELDLSDLEREELYEQSQELFNLWVKEFDLSTYEYFNVANAWDRDGDED